MALVYNLPFKDYNLADLEVYKKYKTLIDSGLIMVPDERATRIRTKLYHENRQVSALLDHERHEVNVYSKKVILTQRASLRQFEVEGVTFDYEAQAACNIYDPYDEFFDIGDEIRDHADQFTFIPIVDAEFDQVRYTVSKYSKGFKKYFNPKKVVKAVYFSNEILFYVKDKHDILRKYFFYISTVNMRDIIPLCCKVAATKNGLNSDLYIAFFKHMEDLPFTIGARKEDFYALKDILDQVTFKGTTPLKYMVFKEISGKEAKYIKTKQAILFEQAMVLQNKTKKQLCSQLKITEQQYNDFIDSDEAFILSEDNKKVDRKKIGKYLNMVDNFFELKYYESLNLIWKVKFKDIPGRL